MAPPDRRSRKAAFSDGKDFDLPDTPSILPADPVVGAIRKLQQMSLDEESNEVNFQYDSDTGETEIAPYYPSMPPVSTNLDDIEFLRDPAPGIGTLIVSNPDGTEFTLENLDLDLIERSSPCLASSFVRAGKSRVFRINFPQTPVIALLRAMYQSDYTFCSAMLERPVALLLHLQVLSLGLKFRCEQVTEQARQKALKEIDSAGTSGRPPLLDLCECIRYVYADLRHCHDLRRSIANYSLQFYQHHNGEIFRQTAFESPAFHRDLQHANFVDQFSKPYAAEITQLPVCEHWTHNQDMPAWKGANDFTCQFHPPEADDPSHLSRLRRAPSPGSFMQRGIPSTQLLPGMAHGTFKFSSQPSMISVPQRHPEENSSIGETDGLYAGRFPEVRQEQCFSFDCKPGGSFASNAGNHNMSQSAVPPSVARREFSRRLWRSRGPWLPKEEQAVNDAASVSQKRPLPGLTSTHRDPSWQPDLPYRGSADGSSNAAASSNRSENAQDDPELFQIVPLHLVGDISDSEWSMVEAPVTSETQGEPEEASMSDSDWSEIDLPTTPRA